MIMEELKKDKSYNIEWVDGSSAIGCIYEKEYRGFLLFVDQNKMRLICRPSSIRQIKETT